MKRLLLTLSLAFSVLFPAAAQSVEANLVEAVQLYSDGRIKKANELLKTLSVADPGNDAVWFTGCDAGRDLDVTVTNCT